MQVVFYSTALAAPESTPGMVAVSETLRVISLYNYWVMTSWIEFQRVMTHSREWGMYSASVAIRPVTQWHWYQGGNLRPYITILSWDQEPKVTKLSVRIILAVGYLDIEGEAGAEAGREEGEENEESLRCEGGPPVLQPESWVIRRWWPGMGSPGIIRGWWPDMEDILLRDTELARQVSAVSDVGGCIKTVSVLHLWWPSEARRGEGLLLRWRWLFLVICELSGAGHSRLIITQRGADQTIQIKRFQQMIS